MSGVVTIPESRAAARSTRTSAVPFGRLFRVEWRKQLDTRAGRWLLATIAVAAAVVIAVSAIWGGDDLTFEALLITLAMPLSLLLPVVGILAATQEHSQRTGLVTFVLEPRRLRVGTAKLAVALLTGVVAVVVSVGLAAATYALLVAFRGVGAQWLVDGPVAWGLGLSTVLSMVQGVAFGLLLQNTPLAIVVYFVLPSVFSLGAQITPLEDVWPWVDLVSASAPLLTGGATGTDWAHLATASLIWIVGPLVAGLVRLTRSEVRST
jgi:ABC-type transport system involved in multi-copper enzyme maturation permease subunit